LTVGSTYAFNIYYDYLLVSKNECGFDYLDAYNATLTPPDRGPTSPTADDAPFYTVGADITSVGAPVDAGDGLQRYIQVTFQATAETAEFYWGFHLALPGAVGTCKGAADFSGASLQTDVRDVPEVEGATMVGGGGSLQINPNAIVRGSISVSSGMT
jgi:hypothetical protein